MDFIQIYSLKSRMQSWDPTATWSWMAKPSLAVAPNGASLIVYFFSLNFYFFFTKKKNKNQIGMWKLTDNNGQWEQTVNDPSHCEFAEFRTFLLQTHLHDLIETTGLIHYETFRTKQLLALKESTSGGMAPPPKPVASR